MTESYNKIEILDNDFEAQVLKSILEERGVPHRMISYYDSAFDGLYQTQKGWGYVSADDTFADEIREIIADLRKDARAAQMDDDTGD